METTCPLLPIISALKVSGYVYTSKRMIAFYSGIVARYCTKTVQVFGI